MKNKPLVSIVIPVYNVEKYIEQCLNSVVNQTYKNLEIITIIDGSKDKSEAIVEEFAKKDNRIRIISRENQGLLSTRIEGIKKCKGEYIIFVDSDDWINLSMIEEMLNIALQTKADLVKCSAVEENIQKGKQRIIPLPFEDVLITKEKFKEKIYPLFFKGKNLYICAQLIRTAAINITNINELQKNINCAEDVYANLTIYETINSVYFLNKTLYHYRSNPEGITKDPNIATLERNLKEVLFVYNKIFDKLIYWEMDNIENRKATSLKILEKLSAVLIKIANNNQVNFKYKYELIASMFLDKKFIAVINILNVNDIKSIKSKRKIILLNMYKQNIRRSIICSKLFYRIRMFRNFILNH